MRTAAALTAVALGVSLVVATTLGSGERVAEAASIEQRAVSKSAKVSTKKLLGGLKVRGETPAGYARSKFQHWVDADRDGCDTRAEVLVAESVRSTRLRAGCTVAAGRWVSRYDKKTVTTASKFDIDHLVPLNEAWQSGARRWSAATRTAFANDLAYAPSLAAVSASTNRSKGDREPHRWMPPRKAVGCSYVAEWVAVKWRWRLAIDKTEKKFVRAKLRSCGWPKVTKPRRAGVTLSSGTSGAPAAPAGGASAKRYANCTALRLDYPHGVGRPGAVDSTTGKPVTDFHVSEALYGANSGSDRDKDGIACEA